MKNLFPYIIIISLALSACKKDKHATPIATGDKFAISFNVSGFSQVIGPVTNGSQNNLAVQSTSHTTQALKDVLNTLRYRIYNSSNVLIRDSSQSSALGNFGTIRDSIPAGNYTAIFMGNVSGVDNTYFYNAVLGVTGQLGTYYKKISFTVVNSSSHQDVVLDQLDGVYEIHLKDTIPANVSSIQIGETDNYAKYSLDNATRTPIAGPAAQVSLIIPSGSYTRTNFVYKGYIRNTGNPITITLTAGSGGTPVIAKKTLTGLIFHPSTKTIITGKLFGSSTVNSGGFTIQYQALSADTIKMHF